MKPTIITIACLIALSCEKPEEAVRPIALKAPVNASSSVDYFYVTAVKEDGTFLFQASSFTKGSGGVFTGGHYWPLSGRLSFYADNCSASRRSGNHGNGCMEIRMQSGDDTITADAENVNCTDASVNLSFGHPLARLYALSLSSADGSQISVNSISVRCRRSGWYCLMHRTWTSFSPYETVTFPAEMYSCGDILLAPGETSITLNYTATIGSHSVNREKTASFILEAGKRTTVNASIGADSVEITTSLEVEDWGGNGTVNTVL